MNKCVFRDISLFLLLGSSLFLANSAFASKVISVKENRILIQLEGDSPNTGEELYLVDEKKVKKAIVKITQVKDGRAIAEVKKGVCQVGFKVMTRDGKVDGVSSTAAEGGAAASPSPDSTAPSSSATAAATAAAAAASAGGVSTGAARGDAMGVYGSYLMNSMTATFTAGTLANQRTVTASMAGNGLGLVGFYDYYMDDKIQLQGLSGLEQYNVATTLDSPECDGLKSADCNVKITYLSFYGFGRYSIWKNKKLTIWGGGGLGFLVALLKSSTVLNPSEITTNMIGVVNLGLDYRLGQKSFIPISLDYGMFPSSADVKASIIYIRVGYGWKI